MRFSYVMNSMLYCIMLHCIVSQNLGSTTVGCSGPSKPKTTPWSRNHTAQPLKARLLGGSRKLNPNSDLQLSYGVDYRTLRWIYFLGPPRGLASPEGLRSLRAAQSNSSMTKTTQGLTS